LLLDDVLCTVGEQGLGLLRLTGAWSCGDVDCTTGLAPPMSCTAELRCGILAGPVTGVWSFGLLLLALLREPLPGGSRVEGDCSLWQPPSLGATGAVIPVARVELRSKAGR